jgi:hypothetical protein
MSFQDGVPCMTKPVTFVHQDTERDGGGISDEGASRSWRRRTLEEDCRIREFGHEGMRREAGHRCRACVSLGCWLHRIHCQESPLYGTVQTHSSPHDSYSLVEHAGLTVLGYPVADTEIDWVAYMEEVEGVRANSLACLLSPFTALKVPTLAGDGRRV